MLIDFGNMMLKALINGEWRIGWLHGLCVGFPGLLYIRLNFEVTRASGITWFMINNIRFNTLNKLEVYNG